MAAELPRPRAFIDAHPVTSRRLAERGGVRYDTPWSIADALAVPFISQGDPVWWGDPCAGVGRLVIACLDAIRRRGGGAEHLGTWRRRLHFSDLDAEALAVAQLAVRLWSAQAAMALQRAGRSEGAARLARQELGMPTAEAEDVFEAEHEEGAWIITNPPFENIRALHRRIGPAGVEALKARHDVCVGAFDTGVPVVAQCIDWARGGKLGLVLPRRWRSVDYAHVLRARLDALGPWAEISVASRGFDASVDVMAIVSDSGGEPIHWLADRASPLGSVTLESLARVGSGTPGFEAKSISLALTEAESPGAFRFLSAGSVRPYVWTHDKVRLSGRVVEQPWLPLAAVRSAKRVALYEASKLIVPGVAKQLCAAWVPVPCALSVGVIGIVPHRPELRGLLLGVLNSAEANGWMEETMPGRALTSGYHRFGARQLRKIPVPDPERDDVQSSLAELNALADACAESESARKALAQSVRALHIRGR